MARRQGAARAGRTGRNGEPGPVQLVQQRLPVDIETGEGDQVRQPPHRIADHLHVGHQLRHPRPDPVHQGAQPCGLGLRLRAYRPQRGRGGHDRRDVLETGRPPRLPLVGGPWGANRTPLRTASSPTPAGPPHLCALAVSSDQRAGHRTPAQRLGGVHQQRHPGRPAQISAASATGCSVPTSWLADCRQASAVSARSARPYAAGSTAPVRSTGTSVNDAAAPPRGPRRHGVPRSARRRRAPDARPTRRRPESAPAMPECTARVPEEVKTSSSGRQPTASAAVSRPRPAAARPAAPRGRGGRDRPSPRPGRRAAPGGRRGAGGRRKRRRSRARRHASPRAGRAPGDAAADRRGRGGARGRQMSGRRPRGFHPFGVRAARWAPSPRDPK